MKLTKYETTIWSKQKTETAILKIQYQYLKPNKKRCNKYKISKAPTLKKNKREEVWGKHQRENRIKKKSLNYHEECIL